VKDSEIYNNATQGIQIYNSSSHGDNRANNNIICNNKIYDNARLGKGSGITVGSGDGNAVYNNIIWGSAHTKGISVYGHKSPRGTKVYNNTIYNIGSRGIDIQASNINPIVQNNIVYRSGDIINESSSAILTHNLTLDPKFVNVSALDFSLREDSPAIDMGTSVSEVTDDFKGTPRFQGTGYDIGAYEYYTDLPSQPLALAPATNLRIVSQ
jgi:hypothetical protein